MMRLLGLGSTVFKNLSNSIWEVSVLVIAAVRGIGTPAFARATKVRTLDLARRMERGLAVEYAPAVIKHSKATIASCIDRSAASLIRGITASTFTGLKNPFLSG